MYNSFNGFSWIVYFYLTIVSLLTISEYLLCILRQESIGRHTTSIIVILGDETRLFISNCICHLNFLQVRSQCHPIKPMCLFFYNTPYLPFFICYRYSHVSRSRRTGNAGGQSSDDGHDVTPPFRHHRYQIPIQWWQVHHVRNRLETHLHSQSQPFHGS